MAFRSILGDKTEDNDWSLYIGNNKLNSGIWRCGNPLQEDSHKQIHRHQLKILLLLCFQTEWGEQVQVLRWFINILSYFIYLCGIILCLGVRFHSSSSVPYPLILLLILVKVPNNWFSLGCSLFLVSLVSRLICVCWYWLGIGFNEESSRLVSYVNKNEKQVKVRIIEIYFKKSARMVSYNKYNM